MLRWLGLIQMMLQILDVTISLSPQLHNNTRKDRSNTDERNNGNDT